MKNQKNTKILLKAFIILLANALLFLTLATPLLTQPVDALSRVGSRGQEVTQIQQKLAKLGYYKGKIDGIYGQQTRNAVISFQKNWGLAVDGIAGPKTLAALGLSSSSSSSSGYGGYSKNDLDLLARIISAETRGEPFIGQVAVGAVILNRIKHPSFPNTLAGVIYQPGAFSCLTDGQVNQPVVDSAYRAARSAIDGYDPSGGAIYYYNPAKTSNQWMLSRPVITVIGNHRFCR